MSDVTVRIPASPAYLQVVRLVAAGLATRLGFTIDEIEDLKIGVDELCAYFTGTQGRDGTIEIRFGVHDDKLEISGVGNFAPGQKVRTDLTELSKMILDTVSDEASLSQVNGSPAFNLSKTHR
jgi:anti-sigma regulatory factor (Ser/Thr protein kinase)